MKLKASKDSTLLQLLTSEGGYSTTTKARQIIKNGAVWINNKVEKIPSAEIKKGSVIEINPERSKQEAQHAKYLFKVVYEDSLFIAAVKPPRMAVSGSKSGKPGFKEVVLLAMQNEKKDIQQLFPIYTIDLNSTGVVLFAKNQKTLVALQGQKINKTWLCLVEGRVKQEAGEIKNPLVKTPTGKMIAVEKATKLSEDASTKFRVRKQVGKFSLVEAFCETMLHKQLQAHFQSIGNPVAGEKRYGASLPFKARNGIHLEKISFVHPLTDKIVEIASNVPQTFTRAGRYI